MSSTVPAVVEERWLPIPSYEGFYEVSDQGRIRSLDRVIRKRNGQLQTIRGRLLKQFLVKRYYSVLLHGEPGLPQRQFLVHRLVLLAFIGQPAKGCIGCHGPAGNRDNSLANLYWGTHSRNNGFDRHRDGKMAHARLSEAQVLAIRQDKRILEELASEYGASITTIHNARTGKTWKHLPHFPLEPLRVYRRRKRLTPEERCAIALDPRSGRQIASDYSLDRRTVDRIKKQAQSTPLLPQTPGPTAE